MSKSNLVPSSLPSMLDNPTPTPPPHVCAGKPVERVAKEIADEIGTDLTTLAAFGIGPQDLVEGENP